MISSRPTHIRTIITIFEKSLNSAYEPNGPADLRVDGLVELPSQDLPDQQVADDLDRPCRRARGAADEHQADDDHGAERAPRCEVGAREPCPGHDRDRLKHAVPDGGLAGVEVLAQ